MYIGAAASENVPSDMYAQPKPKSNFRAFAQSDQNLDLGQCGYLKMQSFFSWFESSLGAHVRCFFFFFFFFVFFFTSQHFVLSQFVRSYKHFHAFMQSQKINTDTCVSSNIEAEMHENIPDALNEQWRQTPTCESAQARYHLECQPRLDWVLRSHSQVQCLMRKACTFTDGNSVRTILLSFFKWVHSKGTTLFPLKAILSELFCLTSKKSSTLKGKNLLPLRVKFLNSRHNIGQDSVSSQKHAYIILTPLNLFFFIK